MPIAVVVRFRVCQLVDATPPDGEATISGDESGGVRVVADRGILWRELAVLLGPPTVFVGAVWLPTGDDVVISVPWAAGFWVFIVLACGVFGALPIWVRHHRTIVEATADRLTVRSRKRVLLDLPASEILQVRVYGWGSWSSIIYPYNHHPGPFPLLTVWSSERWQSPPLMLWGRAGIELERELNQLLRLPRYRG